MNNEDTAPDALDDPVMEKVDSILSRIDKTAELEVLIYAATA